VECRRRLDRGLRSAIRAGGVGRAGRLAAKAFRKHFEWEWLRVLRSFVTTERTIRRTGTRRSVADKIHIQVSIISDTEEKWRSTMETARQQYQGLSSVTVLLIQNFGAQPGSLNSLGYKDSIGQPAIEGSGVEPLPGQGQEIQSGGVRPRLSR